MGEGKEGKTKPYLIIILINNQYIKKQKIAYMHICILL
jgi:hypothetical protein